MFKKIYDAVLYNGEIELFALRTHVLKPYVEGFYVIDSPDSINGAPKLAAQLADQLKDDTVLERFPWLKTIKVWIHSPRLEEQGSWPRQHEIRNKGFHAVLSDLIVSLQPVFDPTGIWPSNIGILWGDIDEIPDTQLMRLLKNQQIDIERNEVFEEVYGLNPFDPAEHVLAIPQLMCYGSAQFTDNCVWHGTRFISLKMAHALQAEGKSGEHIRNVGQHRLASSSTFLGWHYSYMGDKQRIREKLKAFSHAELSSDWHVDHAVEQLEKGLDPFDREGMQWKKERGVFTERGSGLWIFDQFPFMPSFVPDDLKAFLKYSED